MSSLAHVESFAFDSSSLTINWADGRSSAYDPYWLWDNDLDHFDRHSGQRLADINDLSAEPAIAAVDLVPESHLLIHWREQSKTTCFDLLWLRAFGHVRVPEKRAETFAKLNVQRARYPEVLADPGHRQAVLAAVARDGTALLAEVPPEPGQILSAAPIFGFVRETNYGKLFDVRSIPDPNNLAFTDLGLSLHTDNPYREPVPGLQLLHCLEASDDGGENVFADGFAAAERLREESPEAFATLSTAPVPFVFDDGRSYLAAERPIIKLDLRGAVEAVHLNNRSMATLRLPAKAVRAFYVAYRELGRLLRAPELQVHLKLTKGDLIVFDNLRILHGRTAFNGYRSHRHLQGCYVDRDGLISNLVVLERLLFHGHDASDRVPYESRRADVARADLA